MKKIPLILVGILLCIVGMPCTAKNTQADKVVEIIHKVNECWQKKHPQPGNSFWDNAAYHTGNMEVFFLTGHPDYYAYSKAWAERNEWKGAKSDDKAAWKYSYGESDEYVLFGDYQICFQTYIDLYTIKRDSQRIARACEVMEYQISTDKDDYWWWADGLYMAMPVMTKMYRLTENPLYLEKLHTYWMYANSIMYDEKDGLYYRDAKYVFPKHKSVSGKKDFWARGNGWVLAALAKVLKDLPETDPYRQEYIHRFQAMAKAIASSQQPEGYWTRSMLDPVHAPGPETSGTAFFTYGLLWGINNGFLDITTYEPVIRKAWDYLNTVALQLDGSVGYVQPIGEKAIPGQIVNARSEANFGVGAFLLAACEYVRYLESSPRQDREYWCELLYQIAAPVLSNMAEGKLQQNMLVETSSNWDGRDVRVTYMEAFGRLMAGLAPWLSLPDDNTSEGQMRRQLREWALKSYTNAVDPQSPDYLLWRKEGQPLVDAAYIAESFVRGYDALWKGLDHTTQQRYIEEFTQMRRTDPPNTNWILFSSVIESFLAKAGAPFDAFRVNTAIRKVDEWYVGDGWYADGPSFAFDYYSSYVFHPMYLETLQNMIDSQIGTRIPYPKYYEKALARTQKYSIILERLISPEGTFPVFGRSIPYRMASMQPLALMAWYERLPGDLNNGQVRSALTAVLHAMFDGKSNFNSKGFLTIGFAGPQPHIADWYTNNGSLYMTSLSLLPLGLPASHPFWTDAAQPWTCKKAWSGKPFPKDHHWNDGDAIRDLY